MYRILLVDDEPSIIKTVGKRLEFEGFEVLSALDGRAALKIAQAEPVDLILLDLIMPEMDGFEVCQRLREMPRHQRTPIVILTAKTSDAAEQRARDAGATAFLRKPFRAEEVLQTVRTLLAGSSGSAPPDLPA